MMKANTGSWLAATVLAVLCAGCAADLPAPDFHALVASADRSEADRANDARRKPAQLLEFYGVRPGMTALDLGAGTGYNTELLARAVGAAGRVYAQNTRSMVDNMLKGRFDGRLQKPVMKNVVHVVREFDDPLPSDVRNLDLVTFNFTYHDVSYMKVDRAKMNRAVFSALKPGGILILQGYTPKQLEYKTGGPPLLSHLYPAEMLRAAFAAMELIELREYETELREGTQHYGHSALIGLVARKP